MQCIRTSLVCFYCIQLSMWILALICWNKVTWQNTNPRPYSRCWLKSQCRSCALFLPAHWRHHHRFPLILIPNREHNGDAYVSFFLEGDILDITKCPSCINTHNKINSKLTLLADGEKTNTHSQMLISKHLRGCNLHPGNVGYVHLVPSRK